MTTAIAVEALTKRYGTRTALDGLDLEVRAGEVLGLIGPNGAGKTTTARILLDLVRPTSGSVRVLGEDPRHGGPALRRRIGYLPGELRLEARTDVAGLLRFYARLSGGVPWARVAALADRLGLDTHRQVRTLSKGNKQKVGLVQAFAHDPELLVLDEPTSGLDPLLQQEFLRLVREARDRGATVLLSSHVLSEVQHVADRAAVLRDGRLVVEATVDQLRRTAVRHVRVALTDVGAEGTRDLLDDVPGVTDVTLPPAGLAPDGEVRCVVTGGDGGLDPLVRRLAGHHLRDLVVEEPDLEEAVLALYSSASTRSPAPEGVRGRREEVSGAR